MRTLAGLAPDDEALTTAAFEDRDGTDVLVKWSGGGREWHTGRELRAVPTRGGRR